jgi:hypothetical protein
VKWSVVIAIVVVSAMAGCSTGHGATPAPEGTYGCGQVSVDRWATADPRSPDEPSMRLPQPPNWKRVNSPDYAAARLVMHDDAIGKMVPPSLVVWITDVTGRLQNPQAVIDAERANITKIGATDIKDLAGKVCDFQATTFNYTSANGAPAPRPVKTVVITPQFNGKLFDVVLTMQAGDDGGDTYQHDAQTILTGMEIKAPKH